MSQRTLLWTTALIATLGLVTGVPNASLAQTPPPSAQQSAELEEAERLMQQAFELYQQGKYAEAIPLAQRSLAIREKVLGPEHPDVATSLNNLALLYSDRGNYAEAEPLYQRSLTIREKALGPEHPSVATSLNNLAGLYRQMGNYAEAEPLYQRSLAIFEKVLGPEHPFVATSLNNLAALYSAMGNYAEAEPLFQRSLAIREKVLGSEHPDVAQSFNNLAALYDQMGNYAEAEPLYQRSLAIREKVLDPEHPDVAQSLNDLALLYSAMGNYAEAEPLYQRSLAIREKVLGSEHPDVAQSLNNLAQLYSDMGNYAEAEPLYQRSLAIREKVLGSEHPDVAQSLNNLAQLYSDMGNYAEAEPLYQRSLAIREKVLGSEHPDVAQSLNNLAQLYSDMGNYAEAEPLYQRSLAIREKVLGSEHPDVALSLNNLAGLYRQMGNYAEAEPLYQRSLAIREKVLGSEHPDVAQSLNNLANLYWQMGNYAEAEPLYQRSLAILEKALGPEHPNVATNLENLTVLALAQAKIPRAIAFLTHGVNIQEQHLAVNLTLGSESQKQAYMATLSGKTSFTVSLHLQHAPNNPDAARLALTTILRRKGRILEVLSDSLNLLRQNLTPENQALLDQLVATRSQLAALIYNKPATLTSEQYRTEVATLKAQAQQQEADLARRSAEFRTISEPATIEAIQQLIPANAALVELVLYKPFDAKTTKFGDPRYVAYILNAAGEIQWVDLGEATPIDQAVAEFRQALQSQSPNIQTVARSLDEKLMQPIRQKLGNTRTLLISPDSQLNLIPFAALVDENNQYLVENYAITYLGSGRDLLRLQNRTASRSNPVLIANPDYSNPGNPSIQIADRGGFSATNNTQTGNLSRRGNNQRSTDISQLKFGPLPATLKEAEAIAPLLGVQQITGTQATENLIKQVKSPNILHIATHGFFLDVELVAPPTASTRSLIVEPDFNVKPNQTPPENQENPLLRSGLALAGFNVRKSGEEDGVLTAMEATSLNLWGTKLVVLSACETGIGDIANGEGVVGLRRAFVLAGSESQMLSLWKVDDEGTKDLMVSYYQRLLKNEGRSEALRQIQLEMLQSNNYNHPFYWASFIPSGDWTPMGEVSQ
jgi:CHAT domain-containing protein/Tfp pilus assembly protein PilF